MAIIVEVVREISKLAMFAMLWGFPLWLSKETGNYKFLWFLVVSIIYTMAMFTHYEDLERVDKFSEANQQKQDNEQTIG